MFGRPVESLAISMGNEERAERCLSFFMQRNDAKGLGTCVWLGHLRRDIGYTVFFHAQVVRAQES